MSSQTALSAVGVDAVALKPSEVDTRRGAALDVSTVTIDYEGREHLPEPDVLAALAEDTDVRLTVPVRADGFDPLADDHIRTRIPDPVGEVLVAGHSAYLSAEERDRALAPRLAAATREAADPWVGTEGIERLALAIGGTQFELLSATTCPDVRALRQAGYEGSIAVYAPLVLSAEEGTILDAVGDYAARRPRVSEGLSSEEPTDNTATGVARDRLLAGCRACALVGDAKTVRERIQKLRDAGVDIIVAYPAQGLDSAST
jgi:hypothetical protein